ARDRRRGHVEPLGDEELTGRGEEPSAVADDVPSRRTRHGRYSHPRGSRGSASQFTAKRAMVPTFRPSVAETRTTTAPKEPSMTDTSADLMKAASFARFGAPDVLDVVERPRPRAGAGEVVVRVDATTV